MTRAPRRLGRTAAGIAALTTAAALLAGCGAPETSSASAKELPTSSEDLVAQAKEEGEVVLGAGGHTREQAQLLADEFEKKYGITVTFVRESGGDISQKVAAQLSAGALQFDVISLNDEATLRTWAEDGVLAEPSIENRDDVLATLDASGDAPYLPFTWAAMGYSYNSAKIDPDAAPATWDELAQQPASSQWPIPTPRVRL